MIDILLKYVISECAINKLFDTVTNNFAKSKPSIGVFLGKQFRLISPPTAISIKQDIEYFQRMRERAHPSSYARYDNMISNLEDASKIYYKNVTFRDLAETNLEKKRREYSRRVKLKD